MRTLTNEIGWLLAAVGSIGSMQIEQVNASEPAQLGFTSRRNNVTPCKHLPKTFCLQKSVIWTQRLGSQTNGSPVVADGLVFIGTNNGGGYLDRHPKTVDLGVLLCFEQATGELAWQFSSAKLPTGRQHDWPGIGICSTPFVEKDRLWLVTNRAEIVCLDTQGFREQENDGPFQHEEHQTELDADIVWQFDMIDGLCVLPHNMANCSITGVGGLLFVCTSNGIDRSHKQVASPKAPSFLALDKSTGQVVWSDASPGRNILHGQWSSPSVSQIRDSIQAIFAGGDGWLYSFRFDGDSTNGGNLCWKFDCNSKISRWGVNATPERNNLIATPVTHGQRVFITTGQSPDRGTGPGQLWCLDASKHTDGRDVSSELALDAQGDIKPHSRIQAVDRANGELLRINASSAAEWCYTGGDWNNDGRLSFREVMHRSIGSVVVKNRILVAADSSGIVHCVEAHCGKPLWTFELMAEVWASPLIVGRHVLVADTDGTISIFRLSSIPEKAMQLRQDVLVPHARWEFGSAIHGTPTVSQGVLFVATQERLYALQLDE